MFFIQFAYCIVISVDITDGNMNESVRILKCESNKWEVSLISFDILEMKKRIEPCEFFIDFNENNNFRLLINIEDPKRILNNNLLFNLSLFPQYDVRNYYRSSTFQFKTTETGFIKMVYIPSSIVALLIKLNLLYKSLIVMSGIRLSVSNCSLYKNYVQTCTFHNVDHVDYSKNRFKCDYQDYIAYVIGELNCVHNLNINEGYINSLIANLLFVEESKIYEIYDIVKDDIDRLSHIIFDSIYGQKLVNEMIYDLIGKHFFFQMA